MGSFVILMPIPALHCAATAVARVQGLYLLL